MIFSGIVIATVMVFENTDGFIIQAPPAIMEQERVPADQLDKIIGDLVSWRNLLS